MILLSDPRVAAVPLRDRGEALVALAPSFGPARALVRSSLADRLADAAQRLPRGVALRVVEGHRSPADQQAIIARYSAQLGELHPGIDGQELARLTSRFVSPLAVAPHVAGAAVDLTLAHDDGRGTGAPLDLGTEIDATPEQSDGRCFTAAPVGPAARANRDVMAEVLGGAGLVNYPTEWWHWSYGDRYWALTTGAPAALHGPLPAPRPAGARRRTARPRIARPGVAA